MSNYTDASLIYYPSGYKAGKAYSLKPTDGSGDLTFTRASTATRVNESGLIESVATGVPRIDYTGGGCGKLLLEPQRTNLLPYSVGGGTGYSTFGTVTVTNNFAVSPDGTTTSTRVNGSGVWRYRNENNTSLAPSTNYTFSVYVKSNTAGNQTFRLYLYNANFSADLVATPTWQRFTFNSTSSASVTQIHGLASDTSNNAADVQVWGWQMEQGSFPTSYIPTLGTAVTRVSDNFQSIVSSNWSSVSGTFFLKLQAFAGDASYRQFSLYGSGNDSLIISYTNTTNQLIVTMKVGGSTIYYMPYVLASLADVNSIAFAYTSGNTKLFVNGFQVGASSGIYSTSEGLWTKFCSNIGANYNYYYGYVNEIALFKTRLSDAQLATLTTL